MDKEMLLLSVDIIRSVSDKQKGIKKLIGKLLNKLNYIYYKTL